MSVRLSNGFTLIEMLLAVTVLSLIVATTLPLTAAWLPSIDLANATTRVAQQLRVAQERAMGSIDDTQWGLQVSGNVVTIFEGTTYLTRVVAKDETTTLSSSISFTGTTEIVFSRLEGRPLPTTVTLNVVSSVVPVTKVITINSLGMVSF